MKNLKKAAAITMIAGGLVAVGAGAASATGHSGADAHGVAAHSPGVVGGNLAQVPVAVPVNAVGNTVNVVGLLNPAFGNFGLNH
ncbi:chaplin [Streptomyces sp. NPDC017524]|uniref:chaplin n=1 Tax=unclassified Streptomyces TaxID=2593676 RepID=UPI0037952D33